MKGGGYSVLVDITLGILRDLFEGLDLRPTKDLAGWWDDIRSIFVAFFGAFILVQIYGANKKHKRSLQRWLSC